MTQGDLLTQVLEVSAVLGAPAGATWLLLDTVSGPRFSGLPAWFPVDAQIESVSIPWWSECAGPPPAAR